MPSETGAGAELSLAELAERTSVPARTIRYYIARGLLPGPRKGGRGAAYGPEHVERLERIRQLQAQGYSLADIARTLAGGERSASLPSPVGWWCYQLADDVQVWVRADAKPWRLHRIRRVLLRMAAELDSIREENSSDDHRD